MNRKKRVGLGVGLAVLIIVAWVLITAGSLASEASKADALLKESVTKHLVQSDVDSKLKAMGYELTETPKGTQGKGPVHSLLVYSTRLTVKLDFDDRGGNTSYHLDRE